jgi:hypothetical protein
MNLQLWSASRIQKELLTRTIALGSTVIYSLFVSGCVSSKAVMRDDSVKFPKSRFVEILDQKPEKPHVVIATLETKGGIGVSLPEILEDMRNRAKEIGADAIIPTQDVSEYKSPGIIYNPWLGGYQTFPGGRVPALRGYAIVYKSTIQRLKRSGYNFRQTQKLFSGGIGFNAAPAILNGYGLGVWFGKRKLRFVGEYFSFEIPDGFYGDGFEKGKLESGYRIGIDYFFAQNLNVIYFPIGVENWDYSVGIQNSSIRGSYNMVYFSFGMGYLYRLNDFLYFDSKFSLNASMSNQKEVQIGNRSFVADKAAYNLFLGLGVNF